VSARPGAAAARVRPARRRVARRRRSDSDAFTVAVLTLMATLIAIYDLALLAFSLN
jgi:hypothetical protein